MIYAYDVQATDPDGERVIYVLTDAPEGMTMDEQGRIRWTPAEGILDPVSVAVEVRDQAGATATQNYQITVGADQTPPQVSVVPSRTPVALGSEVVVIVSASDNIGVEGLSLRVNGTPVSLDLNGLATVEVDQVGEISLVATATDAAGNQAQAQSNFAVFDPSNVAAPVIDLPDLGDEVITAPTNIVGTVSDTDLIDYVLDVASVGSDAFVEIVRGTESVTDGVLGQFDPSLLDNNAYTLRLTARDAIGNVISTETTVNVAGELKLGNFQLSLTDLEIPVSGIPITVARTYDSLKANQQDELGYGWRLEFRDTDLRTSLGRDRVFEELGVRTTAFDERTRVYITLPGGQREAFSFRPRIDPISRYFPPVDFGDPTLYRPEFEGDRGVTSTLTVQDVVLTRGTDGRFFGLNGGGYDPANTTYGYGGYYKLTTKQGTVYRIDAGTGDLLTVTDLNGNELSFTDAGIFSNTGKAVTFGRDQQNRVTHVTDPMGYQVKYAYDLAGDLVAVTDREESNTQFKYEEPSRAHYLTEIVDPLDRPVSRTEYNEQGQLVQLFDSDGEVIEITYDPDISRETVKDALSYPTIFEYDERGNIIREIDALGGITTRTFDLDNRPLTLTDPEGITVTHTYDREGNLISAADALGNTTRFTFNRLGEVTTRTNPLGDTTTYVYDERGNCSVSI